MLRWLLLFTECLVLFGSAALVWWQIENEKRRQRVVRSFSSNVVPENGARTTVLIERGRPRGLGAWLKARISSVGTDPRAKSSYARVRLLVLTVMAGLIGFALGTKLTGILGTFAPLLAAAMAGSVPWIFRAKQRDKGFTAIEEQLPDVLDFLARSVRAGNAFSIALELVAAEAREPLKSEFLKVTREMALGAGLEEALHGFTLRVPLLEARLFVVAVLLQRETGGNLSEVLTKLAFGVRERLRLRRQVKAASGQGRLTAIVLTCLPVVTLVLLKLISPDYMNAMTDDPLGRNLLALAVVSQVVGYMVMQKIIRIEV